MVCERNMLERMILAYVLARDGGDIAQLAAGCMGHMCSLWTPVGWGGLGRRREEEEAHMKASLTCSCDGFEGGSMPAQCLVQRTHKLTSSPISTKLESLPYVYIYSWYLCTARILRAKHVKLVNRVHENLHGTN